MMKLVRLESNGRSSGTKITVDGVHLDKVLSFRLEGGPEGGLRLHLMMLVDEIAVDGDVEVSDSTSPWEARHQ